jgi:hypothetical protein
MQHSTRTSPGTRTRRPRKLSARSRVVVAVATALAAALALGSAADARAASYYNIVNTQTGRALQANIDGTVRLAPRNQTNLLQQWKRTDLQYIGNDGRFQSTLTNRLVDCIATKRNGPNPNLIGPATMGICASSDLRNRWLHKWSTMTPTPGISGFQLQNVKSGEYLVEEWCFITCSAKPTATFQDAQLVESDPQQLGALAKWQFKFAGTGP